MSINYMAIGFEPMTFNHESPPITTDPKPLLFDYSCNGARAG